VLAISTTAWWTIGFVIGGAVVAIAATLLIAIILLARRIARQAREIETALDGARENTQSLFELGNVNHTLESLTRALKGTRGEQGPEDERNLLQRAVSRVASRGGGESSA
jgi:hypothetical protein